MSRGSTPVGRMIGNLEWEMLEIPVEYRVRPQEEASEAAETASTVVRARVKESATVATAAGAFTRPVFSST